MSPAPCPESPALYPQANVLTDGFHSRMPRVPESPDAILERQRDYYRELCPQTHLQAWLADDAALMSLRLERCARIERRERDKIALRAEFFWDDDRAMEAEELGARLSKNPARTAARLRRTRHGCEWLIGRWALLLAELDRGATWTGDQVALAFDLLGRPNEFREAPLGDPSGVARAEIAALNGRREALLPADALDRALAMADLTEQSTPELRRLRRYEATLQKRLRWDLHQIQVRPRDPRPNPNLDYLHEPDPEPAPAIEPGPAQSDEPHPPTIPSIPAIRPGLDSMPDRATAPILDPPLVPIVPVAEDRRDE